ncbi:MAG: PhnD/SsuA/transferrin family substrate-binding protein, partial [Xenococcaceae cyanobacterium]
MLRKLLTAIVLIGITSSLLGCTEKPAVKVEKAPVTSGEAIVLGDISFEPEYRIRRFQPIADYLATNLGDIGIGKGEVKIASDKDTMAKWMASGEVDLYFDSLFPAMFAIDQSGAKAILRRWKDGVEE